MAPSIVSGRGGAVGGLVDLGGQVARASAPSARTTSAWTTPSPAAVAGPVGGEHLAPGVERAPQRALARVLAVVEEPDDLDRVRAGRGGSSCPRRRPRPRSDSSAYDLARSPGGSSGRPSGRQLVAEEHDRDEVAGPAAVEPGAELHAAEPADRSAPATSSTCGADLGLDAAAGQRVLRASAEYTISVGRAAPAARRCCWRSARRAGRRGTSAAGR